MTPLQFKVTNKEEYDDLMQRCEQAGYVWRGKGKTATEWSPMKNTNFLNYFPMLIELDDNYAPRLKELTWGYLGGMEDPSPTWQIGQSIPKTALEELISIDQNEDGSITISPELQAKLVIALRGEKE